MNSATSRNIIEREPDYQSLSVKDLLEARDLFHYHLIHKKNVIGTGIGLYLFRDTDPDLIEGPAERAARQERVEENRGPKRLDNCSVRANSWPAIIVLVQEWATESEFREQASGLKPQDHIPSAVYMPDGRSVPICVVQAPPAAPEIQPIPDWHWPEVWFAGGYPAQIQSQGQERMATFGCLVSDGFSVYSLTNRHVTGPKGTPVYSRRRGELVQVGRSSEKQLTRLPFVEVYPEFAGRRTWLTLDVGLVELNDVNDWTSQVYGLGSLGPLADFSEFNIGLKLVGAKVVAYGAASGKLEGRISALFYRHKSVGGYDYVSDFLIAPAGEGAVTLPGDSGTVWHLSLDDEPLPRPLAIEWGAQNLLDGQHTARPFALATSLSNVCKLLDVELVTAHNLGSRPYWGQSGHYGIAAAACDLVRDEALQALMQANLDRISFNTLDIDTMELAIKSARANNGFIPLADVPDLVWKTPKKKGLGGRDTEFVPAIKRWTGPEHPNHYADIDEARQDGVTLLGHSLASSTNLSVKKWRKFYTDQGHANKKKQGLLPFRIWQIFDAMAGFARAGEIAQFVCAAGILAHYVGDACQPLHGSVLSDGFSDQKVMVTHHHRDTHEEYEEESHVGAGVHSTYETDMIDRFSDTIFAALRERDPGLEISELLPDGRSAARATLELMQLAAEKVPPKELVQEYLKAGGRQIVAAQEALWDRFGTETIELMKQGAVVLAQIWVSAWQQGGPFDPDKMGPVDEDALQELYVNEDFLKSHYLDTIETELSQG